MIPEDSRRVAHISETKSLSVGLIPTPGEVEAGGATALPNTSNLEGRLGFKRYCRSVAMQGTRSGDEPVAQWNGCVLAISRGRGVASLIITHYLDVENFFHSRRLPNSKKASFVSYLSIVTFPTP